MRRMSFEKQKKTLLSIKDDVEKLLNTKYKGYIMLEGFTILKPSCELILTIFYDGDAK